MEATANPQQLNKCTNCGGELAYDYVTHSNKCLYCGSVFKTTAKEESPDSTRALAQEPDTNLVVPKFEKQQFIDKMLAWIRDTNYMPAEVFSKTKFGSIELVYVPFYNIKYSYSGTWKYHHTEKETMVSNIMSYVKSQDGGQVLQGNVNGEVSGFYYAGTGIHDSLSDNTFIATDREINIHLLDYIFDVDLSHEDLQPANSDVNYGATFNHFALNISGVWEEYGKHAVEMDIATKTSNPDVNTLSDEFMIKPAVQIQEASKIYVPIWAVTNIYKGLFGYTVYMNAANGEFIGQDSLEPHDEPDSFVMKLFRTVFVFFFSGFILFPLTFMALGRPDIEKHPSLFGSGMIFFLIFLPWLLLRRFRPFLKAYRKQLAHTKRANEMNNFLKSPAGQAL